MKKAMPKDGARGRSAPARDIDAYLADLPKEARAVLEILVHSTAFRRWIVEDRNERRATRRAKRGGHAIGFSRWCGEPVVDKLRRTIRAAAPGAMEKISYGMPIFFHDGMLVGFAAFKHHCNFFPMSMATMKVFRNELKDYDPLKGTIHFEKSKPLPAALVKRIVQARVRENGERARLRKMRKNRGAPKTTGPENAPMQTFITPGAHDYARS